MALAQALVDLPVDELRERLDELRERLDGAGCEGGVGGGDAGIDRDPGRRQTVPRKPYNDGPEAMKHIEMTLEQSRRQWEG